MRMTTNFQKAGDAVESNRWMVSRLLLRRLPRLFQLNQLSAGLVVLARELQVSENLGIDLEGDAFRLDTIINFYVQEE